MFALHDDMQNDMHNFMIWLRADMTCFRDQGPAKCLVLALCVLRLVSASVCLCSSVVGGWGISLCSVSVFVGPWVCAPAFVCFVMSLIVFVSFPLIIVYGSCLSLCFFLCDVQLCDLSLCVLFASLFFPWCSRPFAAVLLECQPLQTQVE